MRTAAVLVLLLLVRSPGRADDWPQYRGPGRDGLSAERGLLPQWPEGGPNLIWTFSHAGVGYSGPAVVGSRCYSLGGRGDEEFLFALDLDQVKEGAPAEAWAVRVGPLFSWEGNRWSAGPSSTPTVDGDSVYALGGNGDLVCVAAADGKPRWRLNLPSGLEAEVNPVGGGPRKLGWGFAWSPLVDGNVLVCVLGGPKGLLAAIDKRAGRVLWRSAEVPEAAAYASPVRAQIGGVRQYIALTNGGLRAVSAADGRLLWKVDHTLGTEVINSPIVRGSQVFFTVGGRGGELVRVSRAGEAFAVDQVYANRNLSNHHGDVVQVDGYLYGASEGKGWVCQGLESGELVWRERQIPAGSVTWADGRLYTFSERDGAAALLEASPAGCGVAGRLALPRQSALRKPQGGFWTPPVVSGGRLFLRDQELVFCFDVKGKP